MEYQPPSALDEAFFANSTPKEVERGTLIQREGETTRASFKVIKGCLLSYVLDKAGKKHIIQFAPEGWFISDMNSYFNQTPSELFIEAIEDSTVIPFAKSYEEEAKNLSTEALLDLNTKFRKSLISANKRLISLLSATAEERYLEFTETYPTLVQRLSQKLIASYIGITPEYLSGIRRKLATK
ncbi:MAG: Crp/Fnr family transcriptional regulator [Saprospiraceae bacterium]